MIAWLKGADSAARTILALFVVAIALCGLLAVLTMCSARREATEQRNARIQAEGRTASAVEAITEIGRLNERGDASDKEVEDAQAAIRQADPADRDRIARHRLCLLQHRADCDGML